MEYNSCVARRTRAKTDQLIKEQYYELLKQRGETWKLSPRKRQKENSGLDDASNQIEIEDEQEIGNGENEPGGSKMEGINGDNNDYVEIEYETNTPECDAKIGSKSKLRSNKGDGSPNAKNLAGEVSTFTRLVDYSDDSSSSNDENDNVSLSSSDTFDEDSDSDSDDEMDSVKSSSSEEGSDDEEFDAVKYRKKAGGAKTKANSRIEISEGNNNDDNPDENELQVIDLHGEKFVNSKSLEPKNPKSKMQSKTHLAKESINPSIDKAPTRAKGVKAHSRVPIGCSGQSQPKSPLTEKNSPQVVNELSDSSDSDSSSSSKDSVIFVGTNYESEESGGADFGSKNADRDAKKKKSKSKDKDDHFEEIDMNGNKITHFDSIMSMKAGQKRRLTPSAKESINPPLGEDPVISSEPRKIQSQLKSFLRKNFRLVNEEEEETREPTKRRRIGASKGLDIFKVIVDSILDKGVIDDRKEAKPSSLADENGLPLKFRFEDKAAPPEKTEFEKMVEDMFAHSAFGLTCDEIGSLDYPPSEEDENSNVPETQMNQLELCRREKHHLVLDEEIGIRCIYCGVVVLEIRYVMTSFKNFKSGMSAREKYMYGNDSSMFDGLQFKDLMDDSRGLCKESNGTVWDKVPGIRDSMYPHQTEGFEFIWKNLEGTIRLDELKNNDSSGVGGCIISHAPGTGKTRLTIVFIETYLKLFPKCQPVIIAPASMLLTWEEEFKKWKVNFPFHNLNNSELSGKESEVAVNLLRNNNHTVQEKTRMLKLYSWFANPSILGVSYNLYEKLAGGESFIGKKGKSKRKVVQNKEVNGWAKILLEVPGLVVLDEGHTPRNERSGIWNTLLKLQTEKRIILSGTPFQNNFGELFNTLHIVRPAVAKLLAKDKTFIEAKRKYLRIKNARGKKLVPFNGSSGKIWDDSIEKLKARIAPFVHVHKGSILQESLPGLRDSVVLLNPGSFQKQIIDRVEISQNTFEFEHKVALVSIHPSLIGHCTLSAKEKGIIEKDELKKHALNPNKGVKTRFIMELIRLSVALNEKVLIFSQYIHPLGFIKDQLKAVFGWDEGKQVLQMQGQLDQKLRQGLINVFNDPKSKAKVLLASTKCCSEGINLVGASRVVLLDVVWNPSVERQAISRAYRLGQKKVVYTYHLITAGTTEGDKYCRQAEKDRLSELVFCSNSKEQDDDDHNKQRNGEVLNDKILEEMFGHIKLKDMFEKIIYQPKETKLIENFGLGMK